jgi:hypothetical protein
MPLATRNTQTHPAWTQRPSPGATHPAQLARSDPPTLNGSDMTIAGRGRRLALVPTPPLTGLRVPGQQAHFNTATTQGQTHRAPPHKKKAVPSAAELF